MSEVRGRLFTFLFTDIEGSTKHWDEDPAGMQKALARHDEILRNAIETSGGRIFKRAGDSFLAVFEGASQAVHAAVISQIALQREPWDDSRPIAVRMAVHTGEAQEREGDFFGTTLNRCHRLMSAAHGGQILVSAATAALVRDHLPPGTTLRDLGEHRLRDLVRPEPIYQVVHPDLRSEFPPIRTLSAFAHNLPVQSTTFLGRHREIAEIANLFQKARLITLTGTGGVGKTRLALQMAAHLVDAFPDGVWFVDLAPINDPMLVPQTVASTLSVREEAGKELVKTLTEALRPKNLLLILDNCEQLIAACADFAHRILKTCPQVRILATSRERLNIEGETVWHLQPLPTPDLEALPPLPAIGDYEAVQLFLDRAASVRPGFTLTPQNAPAIASICYLLDGIPLAIELAAVRVNVLSPLQIAARLNDRFRLLTAGPRTVLSRHKTLLAAVGWSYDLLSAEEKRLFERLSVFAGGFDLEAAEQVCSGDGIETDAILDLLTLLVEKSLVIVRETAVAASGSNFSDIKMRYDLLNTLRAFAYQKLVERQEVVAVRRQHLEYYLKLAETAEPELSGPHQEAVLDRLSEEHHNIIAALQWVVDEGLELEKGLRLATAIWRYWLIRGVLSEGRRLLDGMLTRVQSTEGKPDLSLLAKANSAAGAISWAMGDYDLSTRYHTEALNLRRAIGDPVGIASSLNNLAINASAKKDYARAITLLQEAVATLQPIGDESRLANCLDNLAGTYIDAGDFAAARGPLQEALLLFDKTGDLWGKSFALYNLGLVYSREGDLRSAFTYLLQSLEIRVRLKNMGDALTSLLTLSNLFREIGHFNDSVRLYSAALALSKSCEQALSATFLPEIQSNLEALKSALGPDVFLREWELGAKMTLDDVLALLKQPIPDSTWEQTSEDAAHPSHKSE
jgi:predicted ATPase/class 3 adenylate cyclase